MDSDGATTTRDGNASGGTIANMAGSDGAIAGSGVYLNNARSVTLRRMTITGTNQNFGIRGLNFTGFTLEYATVAGTNGTSNAGGVEASSISFDGLFGSAALTSSLVSGGATENVRVLNTSGTRGDFVEAIANNNATLDVMADTNDFNNGQAIFPGGGTGVSVRSGSAGKTFTAATTFSITNNTINDGGAIAFDTVGIFVAKVQDLGTMRGTIQDNTLVAKTNSNMASLSARPAPTRSPR